MVIFQNPKPATKSDSFDTFEAKVVPDADEDETDDDEDEAGEMAKDEAEYRRKQDQLKRRKFTIKRLIRLLHINQPVFHVLAILGKK